MGTGGPARGRHLEPRRRKISPVPLAGTVSAGRAAELAHIAGMAERVPAGLRPYGQPMWLLADSDGSDHARRRVDIVNHVVEPPGEPELLSVGADISHVGAAP